MKLPCLPILALSLLLGSTVPAQEDNKEPAEEIRAKSPDGKFALRLGYDRELNEQMLRADNPQPDQGIYSETIASLAIVSLPDKKIVHDLTKNVLSGGNNFGGLTLLWSSDSKWCALYFSFPRTGYTSVYHLEGGKFVLAHPPDELNVDTKDHVRNEHISPVRWVKPGVLQLSVERILRGDDEGDGIIGFTARFDGKGKFQIIAREKSKREP
jgi:hypothetical protein